MYGYAWGRSGKLASPAVEKDSVEGWHMESGSNPLTVPAQRHNDVISTYRMATQAKVTGKILIGLGTRADTRTGGGAKIEAGGSCLCPQDLGPEVAGQVRIPMTAYPFRMGDA